MVSKPHILIVDDEPIIADVLRMAFSRHGWEVDIATKVADALALVNEITPDILLTDKNMPDGSGVELIRHIRAGDPAIGIVMMTAFGTVESARDTLNLGIDQYLEKPFPDLIQVVKLMDQLRARVLERRSHALDEDRGPLTVIVATSDPTRGCP